MEPIDCFLCRWLDTVIATRKNNFPAALTEDQGAPFFWAYFGYPHLRTISGRKIKGDS